MKHKFIVEYYPHEDSESAHMYINGREAHLLLWDYDQWLRNEIKYSSDGDESKIKWLQMAKDKVRELIDEYNLRID